MSLVLSATSNKPAHEAVAACPILCVQFRQVSICLGYKSTLQLLFFWRAGVKQLEVLNYLEDDAAVNFDREIILSSYYCTMYDHRLCCVFL